MCLVRGEEGGTCCRCTPYTTDGALALRFGCGPLVSDQFGERVHNACLHPVEFAHRDASINHLLMHTVTRGLCFCEVIFFFFFFVAKS